MKSITLEEFVKQAKNDEILKEKIIKIADTGTTDDIIALAAEQGYELEIKPSEDMTEMSDEDLEKIAGGARCHQLNIFVKEYFRYGLKK